MKLKARFFSELDIQTRVDWINDLRINQNMSFDIPATYDKTLIWYKNNQKNNLRVDFSIINEDEEVSAMAGLTPIDMKNLNAEFYIMVNPEMFSRGIGSRVTKWLCNYGFIILGLNKIYLYTSDHNVAAYTIYEKLGFKLEGILRQQKYAQDNFQDRRFYGLLKNEWNDLSWQVKTIEYDF